MMLPLAVPSRILKRTLRTDALSRLLLDINASHNADQITRDPAPPVKKSPQAVRGESLRGDVELPRELQDAVTKAIDDADDKPGLRLKALDLYAHLRRTTPILPPPSSYRDRQALTTTYDPPTSLAYLAGLMPSVYGATLHALTSARDRLRLSSDWEPDRVVDFGSGTGSAAWAFEAVWGPTRKDGVAREYVGLDASRSMIELSSAVLGAIPTRMVMKGEEVGSEEGGGGKLDARAHQLPIPSSSSALAKLQISPASSLPDTGKKTIALCAFTLGDQGTKEKRKELVRAMWESGAEVIVIVDRGTPGGSRMVLEAREQLLTYGRRTLSQEQLVEGAEGHTKGSFVVAPCPHDGACPLHNSTRSYCHFSQRVRSPPFLRHTKHSTRGEDDAKFSYVVIQRGPRPLASPPATDALLATALSDALQSLNVAPSSLEPSLLSSSQTTTTAPGDELQWARLVAPPLKRSGHVVLEVCASNGLLERHTIPKSQGRQPYYDARKAAWGDAFPHAPKNGPLAAPAFAGPDAAAGGGSAGPVPKDKFGKDRSKLKSKKAGRMDKGDFEEKVGRGARRSGREAKERGEDGSGVREFEMEIGEGGEFRVVG